MIRTKQEKLRQTPGGTLPFIALVAGLGAAALLASPGAFADTVIMKNGQRMTGVAEDDPADQTMIYFNTTGGQLRISRNDIRELIQDPPAESRIELGNQFFQLGKYEDALEQYYMATRLDPDNTTAQERLEAAKARLRDQQAQQDEQLRQKALELLEEARQFMAKEQFEQAQDKIRAAEARAGEVAAEDIQQALADLYTAWGRSRADRLDYTGAAERYETALQYDPDRPEVRDQLLLVYEKLPGRRSEVVDFYRDKLRRQPANREVALKLADLLQKQGEYREMTELLLQLHEQQPLQDLYYQQMLHDGLLRLVREATDERDYETARNYYAMLLAMDDRYDRSYLHYFDYYIRAKQIDPNSYRDHFELGKFAAAHGMMEEAKQEYLRALMIDPEGEEASQAILKMAEGDLAEARSLAARNDPDSHYAALTRARRIQEEFPTSPEIVDEAREIAQIAELKIRELNRARERSAVDIANRGDDYYAQAQAFIAEFNDRDYDPRKKTYNPISEAELNLQRAINAWNAALQLDPSLRQIGKGDLGTKIADATRILASLRTPRYEPLRFRELGQTRK